MGEIKRYDFVHLGGDFYSVMEEQNGMYVTHEDYAALKDERDRLAAENAALIKLFSERFHYDESEGDGVGSVKEYAEIFMQGDFFTIGCGILLPYEEYEVLAEGEVKLISEPAPLTPATDAFLAEIRAQAVEEFAKYITTIAGTSILRDCGGYKNTPYKLSNAAKKSAIIYADNIRAAAKENNHICKGTNCTSDSFSPHSPECEKEHDKAVRGEK